MAKKTQTEALPDVDEDLLQGTQTASPDFQTAQHNSEVREEMALARGLRSPMTAEAPFATEEQKDRALRIAAKEQATRELAKDVRPWTVQDDLRLLGRITRQLEPAPEAARRRIRAYLLELLSEEIPF